MNLDEEDVFRIANSETKLEALNIIKKKIAHTFKTLSDSSRNEILFDCILDLVYYCLRKGFSLIECVKCCSVLYSLIDQFDKNDSHSNKFVNLTTTLELFKSELISLNSTMLEKKMKDFIDFINLTFISHFNLYKHVFTNERDNQILNQEKQVYAPTEALCSMHLNESKHSSLFDYEVKLAELEKKEKKLNEYYHYERESLAKQEKNLLNLINNEAYSADKRADEETIKKLIDNISLPVTNLASKALRLEYEEYKQREELKEERKKLVKPEDIVSSLKPKSAVSKDNKKSKKK